MSPARTQHQCSALEDSHFVLGAGNEPNGKTVNGGFWAAAPNCTAKWDPCNAGDYVALVKAVASARSADSSLHNERIVGPAADGGWIYLMGHGGWLHQVFALGLLEHIDAVSVSCLLAGPYSPFVV